MADPNDAYLPVPFVKNLPERYRFLGEVPLKPDETRVAFVAKLKIGENDVTVNTGDLSRKEFAFYLSQPVVIGSLDDFRKWCNEKFGSKIPEVAELKKQKVPDFLVNPLESVMMARVEILGLIIDQDKELYHFEVCADMSEKTFNILGLIQITGIGLMITKTGKKTFEPEEPEEKKKTVKEPKK